MQPWEMVLPRVREARELPGISCCSLGKIQWIEAAEEDHFATEIINRALSIVGWKRLEIVPRWNLGTRNRISLQKKEGMKPEDYTLTLGHDTITIYGGSSAGVFYGAQSLAQIIACSAQAGGKELILPAGIIEDGPRFQWRGLMLDSARHFQPKEIIFKLLDHMAEYKLNVFHWHFADRQGWRPVFDCAPELAAKLDVNRSYSDGSYSRQDMEEIRDYAKARFITVVPELEMPGHSAVVFKTHPEYTCPIDDDPYSIDAWEYCISNPATKEFLGGLLKEISEIFSESPVIHIGGDEAGITRWQRCPHCQQMMKDKGFDSERQLEHDFMLTMAEKVIALGKSPMTWATHESGGFASQPTMIIQDWLGGDTLAGIRAGNRVVNSYHHYNYFDYPSGDMEPKEIWQQKNYEFEPVPEEATEDEAKLVLGGEGCIWTEQMPAQRVLPRAVPRMRALAEMLWTPKDLKSFESFQLRERLITSSGLL